MADPAFNPRKMGGVTLDPDQADVQELKRFDPEHGVGLDFSGPNYVREIDRQRRLGIHDYKALGAAEDRDFASMGDVVRPGFTIPMNKIDRKLWGDYKLNYALNAVNLMQKVFADPKGGTPQGYTNQQIAWATHNSVLDILRKQNSPLAQYMYPLGPMN